MPSPSVPLSPGTDAHAQQLILQGQALEDDGHAASALVLYRQALTLQPEVASGHLNEGNALLALGERDAAEASYRRAIALDNSYPAAHFNLANAVLDARRWADAEQGYRTALRLRPDWAEALVGLGRAQEELDDLDAACAAYRRALSLQPDHVGASQQLVGCHLAQRQTAEARAVLGAALKLSPQDALLRRRYAQMQRDAGQQDEAIQVLQALAAEAPGDSDLQSLLLFASMSLPQITAAALYAAHRRNGEHLESLCDALSLSNDRNPQRRLRVGYLSPDFRNHPIASFMVPVLRQHDRAAVEVFCYHNHPEVDDSTRLLQSLSDQWRDVAALNDRALAALIQSDAIDLLVDLAGHTGGSRLAVFALKPAPVQLTWLGYLGSTGLSRIDYRLCDAHTDPVGLAEQWHSERLARLPHSQWCYEALLPKPSASPLPMLRKGYWTFGSFNQGFKLNAEVLTLWAELLRAVPGSRLRFFALSNEELQDWVLDHFIQAGIDESRIDLVPRLLAHDYMASFADVDVALDSFPYNGGTTTCDALLMGLPVAAIAGARTVARSGVSLLRTIGLQDWIAPDIAGFVSMLLVHLQQPEKLAALRAELPDRMRASPLMDAPAFTRDLEALYRQGWRQWCASP